MAEQGSSADKRLVLVVHGVGDQTPGSTVEAFAAAHAAYKGIPLQASQEVLWLTESCQPASSYVECFPVHLRRVKTRTEETVFAEVYWADLSSVPNSILGTLRGFFDVVYSQRHLADYASKAPGRGASALRGLCQFSSFLLRGPVTAINVFLAISVLVVAAFLFFFPDECRQNPGGFFIVLGLAATVIGVQGFRAPSLERFLAFFGSLGLSGVVIATFPLVSRQLTDDPSIGWYAQSIVDLLSLVWGLVALVNLLAFGAWLAARVRAKPLYRPALDLAYLTTAMPAGLWSLAIPTFWTMAFRSIPANLTLHEFAVGRDGLRLMGFHWVLATTMLLFVLLTWGLRCRWSWRNLAADFDIERQAPRLIVGAGLAACAFLSSVAGSGLVLLLIATSGNLGGIEHAPVVRHFLTVLDQGTAIAVLATGGIGLVASFFIGPLRMGLDIALDVINHFRREPYLEGYPTARVRRDRIQDRFRQVLTVAKAIENPTGLAVVSHSQGTIVSIDALASDESRELLDSFDRVVLVTMGSPLTHLYQRYFPQEYGPITNDEGTESTEVTDRWQPLRRTVARWVNIFRIDDFVGTHIAGLPDWPVNEPVDPGGHSDYWIDRRVLRVLEAYSLLSGKADVSAHDPSAWTVDIRDAGGTQTLRLDHGSGQRAAAA